MTPKDEISPAFIEARITEFEKRLDRLYREFELYFVGVEKRPPHQGRRDIMRMFRELEQMPMIRTDLRFRFRGLTQRLTTYKTHWTRTERQIEDGTYHRDVARAKARQQRRAEREALEEEETEAHEGEANEFVRHGQATDGAFELGEWDLDDLDLSSLEQEFEQMDKRGEFEKYVGTRKVRQPEPVVEPPAPRSPTYEDPASAPAVDEAIKRQRLAELQAKLGLSTGGGPGPKNPFERSQQGVTQRARPENPSAPGRGADVSKLRKLQRAKERITRAREQAPQETPQARAESAPSAARPNRIIQRASAVTPPAATSSGGFSEEKSRKIYNTLLQAKERCKEDTSKLNYDAFRHTIERQRTQIQRTKGARDVDFKVVIKDGRAFLKPETKD